MVRYEREGSENEEMRGYIEGSTDPQGLLEIAYEITVRGGVKVNAKWRVI